MTFHLKIARKNQHLQYSGNPDILRAKHFPYLLSMGNGQNSISKAETSSALSLVHFQMMFSL